MREEVVTNQRWLNKKTGYTVRIMGVVEKHVVYRVSGRAPGLQYITDFLKNHEKRS